MGNVTKKSIISGLVWVRGSLGEDQPSFQVVVNKPITLDQGEKIAMLLKQSIDEERARLKQLEDKVTELSKPQL